MFIKFIEVKGRGYLRTLLILSHDLSIESNLSLSEASKNDEKVIPIFLGDMKVEEIGGASLYWIKKSLEDMSRICSLDRIPLFITNGDYIRTIKALCSENRCDRVRIQDVTTFRHRMMVHEIRDFCLKENLELIVSEPNQLLKPAEIDRVNANFQQFSTFWDLIKNKTFTTQTYTDLPEFIPVIGEKIGHAYEKWETKIGKHWNISERSVEGLIRSRLSEDFEESGKLRDVGLSPYIRHGQVTVKSLWEISKNEKTDVAEDFRRELAWREFYTLSYLRRPESNRLPIDRNFERFPWSSKWEDLVEWKMGKTGYSLIDAAMNQLWETGWIQNNLRMVVADFIVKLKLINWTFGAQWFMDTLVDADQATNCSSWQRISGTDDFSWPFARMINPITKALELDPDKTYRKKWLSNPDMYEWEDLDNQIMKKQYVNLKKHSLLVYNSFNNSLRD